MVLRTWITTLLVSCLCFSCSEEVIERGGERASTISFATILTKGDPIQDAKDLAKAGGFHVWALRGETTAPLMKRLLVTSTDEAKTWGYGEPIDWPTGDVSFYAYAPAGSVTVMETATEASPGSIPNIIYTAPADILKQRDLLMAANTVLGSSSGANSTVTLAFNHALSRIQFTAMNAETNDRTTKVKKIELRNIYSKGTTPLNQAAWTADTTTPLTYTLEIGKGLADQTLPNTVDETSTPIDISVDTSPLLLLPQAINSRSAEVSKAEMAVTLLINGGEVTYTAPLPSPDNWEAGKSYTYQIIVGQDEIQVIQIGAGTTLTPWSSGIIIQSILMPSATNWDKIETGTVTITESRFMAGLDNLNTLRGSPTAKNYSWFNYKYFGLYATNSIYGNLTLTIPKDHNFTKGDVLIFDFKKRVENWRKYKDVNDGNKEKPYTVTVEWDSSDQWELSRSYQSVDGITGASTDIPLNYITAPGSIILKSTKELVP